MIASKLFVENYINTKKLAKYSAIGAGLGAAASGIYGGVKGHGRVTDADDRVSHWESKLKHVSNDKEKQIANDKLIYWKKMQKSLKWKNAKNTAKSYAKRGAFSGASIGAATSGELNKILHR